MIGKRMFITGGEGAIADGERFGTNHFLPESAYLESRAAIGSAFFSQRMNELEADGKYIDELERVLYNNLLSSVSLKGDSYFYENPLVATTHQRWAWHNCPCCPPMLLKMVSALPESSYAPDNQATKQYAVFTTDKALIHYSYRISAFVFTRQTPFSRTA